METHLIILSTFFVNIFIPFFHANYISGELHDGKLNKQTKTTQHLNSKVCLKIDKGPEVNVEASAIQTELENRTTSQSQQEYLNETTPEKTDKDVTTENAGIDRNTIEALNENNKYQKVLPGVVVPSPFETALFWPEPTASKKCKLKKEKVPSVTTSESWKAYYLKKNEKKRK
ncbi:hypothetical protein JTB14_017146 [Gonioctena quinquepunctata]|nr:hypothetical protein JTB14_017146 [Gonioctena quinquepunctata]